MPQLAIPDVPRPLTEWEVEACRRFVLRHAGDDSAELLAMLGLDEDA